MIIKFECCDKSEEKDSMLITTDYCGQEVKCIHTMENEILWFGEDMFSIIGEEDICEPLLFDQENMEDFIYECKSPIKSSVLRWFLHINNEIHARSNYARRALGI